METACAIDLSTLLINGNTGRIPKPDPDEVRRVIEAFKARGITYYKLAKAFGVAATAAGKWYRGKNVSIARLEEFKALLAKIERYEKDTGKRFGKQP